MILSGVEVRLSECWHCGLTRTDYRHVCHNAIMDHIAADHPWTDYAGRAEYERLAWLQAIGSI